MSNLDNNKEEIEVTTNETVVEQAKHEDQSYWAIC